MILRFVHWMRRNLDALWDRQVQRHLKPSENERRRMWDTLHYLELRVKILQRGRQ